jgi:hypothetical protein
MEERNDSSFNSEFSESLAGEETQESPVIASVQRKQKTPSNSKDIRGSSKNVQVDRVPSRSPGDIDKSCHSINRLGQTSDHRRGRSTIQTGAGRGGPKLSWKSNPAASFSDWRVEVYRKEAGDVDVYNLHRDIVGFGPRKSNFLIKAFVQKKKDLDHENDASVTRLDVPDSQAAAFPMVLDFMYYTKEVKQSLTAERSCAVFKLAELLDIPALQYAIVDFYQKKISLKNMGEFMTAASQVKATKLVFISKAKIRSLIIEKPELAGLVAPKYLADILDINRKQLEQQRAQDPRRAISALELSQSRHWSKAVFICASHNETAMTKKLFGQLTNAESLPAIDVTVALKLLGLDSKFNNEGSSEYTSLQKRCADSITADWEVFQSRFPSTDAVSSALQKLPSHILADILMKSMNRSQRLAHP